MGFVSDRLASTTASTEMDWERVANEVPCWIQDFGLKGREMVLFTEIE
jgi:hypothetical protein